MAGANPNLPNKEGTTTTHYLVRLKMSPELNKILMLLSANKKVNWNLQNKFGEAPIHHATNRLNGPVVQFLAENGAYVNLSDKIGETPLHKAAPLPNSHDVIKLLLLHGADPTIKSNAGKMCFETVTDNGSNTTIALLRAAVQSRDIINTFLAQTEKGEHLLQKAIEKSLNFVVLYLKLMNVEKKSNHDRKGSDISRKDKDKDDSSDDSKTSESSFTYTVQSSSAPTASPVMSPPTVKKRDSLKLNLSVMAKSVPRAPSIEVHTPNSDIMIIKPMEFFIEKHTLDSPTNREDTERDYILYRQKKRNNKSK